MMEVFFSSYIFLLNNRLHFSLAFFLFVCATPLKLFHLTLCPSPLEVFLYLVLYRISLGSMGRA